MLYENIFSLNSCYPIFETKIFASPNIYDKSTPLSTSIVSCTLAALLNGSPLEALYKCLNKIQYIHFAWVLSFSLCISVSLTLSLFFCRYLCLSLSFSVPLCICPSVSQCMSFSLSPYIYIYIYIDYVYMYIYIYICICIRNIYIIHTYNYIVYVKCAYKPAVPCTMNVADAYNFNRDETGHTGDSAFLQVCVGPVGVCVCVLYCIYPVL